MPIRTGDTFGKWRVIRRPHKGCYPVECGCGQTLDKKTEKALYHARERGSGCVKCRGTRALTIRQGDRFGDLFVLHEIDKKGELPREFACQCMCGGRHIAFLYALRNGSTTQCRRCGYKAQGRSLSKHGRDGKDGISRERGYVNWHFMMQRCYNPKAKGYASYGGRGIRVCRDWHDFWVFRSWFMAQPGHDTPRIQVDRIDNDGGYAPRNCRLGTHKTQARNRRHHAWVRYRGKRVPFVVPWEECGVTSHQCALRRYAVLGWSLRDALLTPAKTYRKAPVRDPRRAKTPERKKHASMVRSNNRIVQYRGRDWIFTLLWQQHGTCSYTTARARLRMGWPIEQVLKGKANRSKRGSES